MERLYHMYIIVSNVPERCVCTSKIKMLYYVWIFHMCMIFQLLCNTWNVDSKIEWLLPIIDDEFLPSWAQENFIDDFVVEGGYQMKASRSVGGTQT